MKQTHFSHPGAILKREWLDEMGIKPGTLARLIGVDRARIKAIIDGKRDITADTAIRFARFFSTSPELWMNLQSHYNLELADAVMKDEAKHIIPYGADQIK